jgi:hypothetical protein
MAYSAPRLSSVAAYGRHGGQPRSRPRQVPGRAQNRSQKPGDRNQKDRRQNLGQQPTHPLQILRRVHPNPRRVQRSVHSDAVAVPQGAQLL